MKDAYNFYTCPSPTLCILVPLQNQGLSHKTSLLIPSLKCIVPYNFLSVCTSFQNIQITAKFLFIQYVAQTQSNLTNYGLHIVSLIKRSSLSWRYQETQGALVVINTNTTMLYLTKPLKSQIGKYNVNIILTDIVIFFRQHKQPVGLLGLIKQFNNVNSLWG